MNTNKQYFIELWHSSPSTTYTLTREGIFKLGAWREDAEMFGDYDAARRAFDRSNVESLLAQGFDCERVKVAILADDDDSEDIETVVSKEFWVSKMRKFKFFEIIVCPCEIEASSLEEAEELLQDAEINRADGESIAMLCLDDTNKVIQIGPDEAGENLVYEVR